MISIRWKHIQLSKYSGWKYVMVNCYDAWITIIRANGIHPVSIRWEIRLEDSIIFLRMEVSIGIADVYVGELNQYWIGCSHRNWIWLVFFPPRDFHLCQVTMTNQADGKREGEVRPPLNHWWMGHAYLSELCEWHAVRVTDGTVLLITTTCKWKERWHCGDIEI